MKIVLTIAGSDSGGGAGIQADLKTFAAFGTYGICAVTAVTAQDTKNIEAIYELPAAFVGKQIDTVMKDINPRVWKTGMLVNSEIINMIIDRVKKYKIKYLVIDPLMVSKSRHKLLNSEAYKIFMTKLIPFAYIITPNCDEAETLTRIKIKGVNDMKRSAVIIHRLGAKHVVIKGGHLKNNLDAIDILYDGKGFREFSSKRIKTKNTHGTGCTYASAIAAGIAKGNSVYVSAKNAKKYIYVAIQKASYLHIGHGFGPLNHFPGKYIISS